MRARLAFVGAAVAALGALTARSLRRKREQPAETDPRAGELRRRLQESRAVVSEREEFEAAETPVDEVEPVAESAAEAQGVDERRHEIHDRARAAAEEMRRD